VKVRREAVRAAVARKDIMMMVLLVMLEDVGVCYGYIELAPVSCGLPARGLHKPYCVVWYLNVEMAQRMMGEI
jgi:hypothetical protein